MRKEFHHVKVQLLWYIALLDLALLSLPMCLHPFIEALYPLPDLKLPIDDYVYYLALFALPIQHLSPCISLSLQIVAKLGKRGPCPSAEKGQVLQKLHTLQMVRLDVNLEVRFIQRFVNHGECAVSLTADSGCTGFLMDQGKFSEVLALT